MRLLNKKLVFAPTDLSNFLSCRHLTSLDLTALKTGDKRPARYGPMIDALRERGIAHEKAYLETLREEGLSISEGGEEEPTTDSIGRTEKAMADGVDIVFQAALSDDTWSGRADFLRKVDTPSDLGDWSYEPIDTKLAQDTKAGTILQLCVYAYLLRQERKEKCPSICMSQPRATGARSKPTNRRLRGLLSLARARRRSVHRRADRDVPGDGLELRYLCLVG